MKKRVSRELRIGDVIIGGGRLPVLQSMCNTDTRDIAATAAQMARLEQAGCQIIRVAVPDLEAAAAIGELKKHTGMPIVADIHFDYRLALAAAEAGAAKIRINPGNIGEKRNIKAVADCCRSRGIPIRIGVNGGSVDRDLKEKYGVCADTLFLSAQRNLQALEEFDFRDICISVKASDVFTTVQCYRMLAESCDYPLHLGVTEAGSPEMGTLKSAAAFGGLLCDGIGDTFRVSLTADPLEEIHAAKKILKALDLNPDGVTVISCPTCGRTQVDLIPIAREVEARLAHVTAKLKVAVMGCAVNGPGEASDADIGIACGKGEGLIIRKGQVLRKVPEDRLADELILEVEKLIGEHK